MCGFGKNTRAATLLFQGDKMAQPASIVIFPASGAGRLAGMAQSNEDAVCQPFGKSFTQEDILLLWRVICLPGMGIFMSQRAN